ncbi:aromatic ring-hydroxylating dioxygenase subunit alpha [Aestuariirhabdus sp. Z084]|uniref:aromatic ring-hydroxylating oxygenase subunit alpha n=1 Tax=Aestuariirhabdus haliotis TaxID=2918751 RepID=UPI00201B4469|nr:aromatic ring-hydroxylating dioxygenase subunit alpha [Aestuariirhabdus haliotis]MCL6414362.1 aromatic ring-hydroxylating dioxygenase subunit alpha [Aestuariirhabdus haliotis]MCL6418294.1 aromatic ring-hydroxylating dioxygenase subunit alpha [Aestuariirhabdus haliotis]
MTRTIMEAYRQSAQVSLKQACGLPFAVYHDPAVYEAEVEQVFLNDWIFACAADRLAIAGDYFAMDIAGEPLILIKGQDGELRALSNSCRHRGTPLLEQGFGRLSKNIVCPYHAWTFDDKGSFRGAPLTGDVVIEKDEHCLARFAVASWNGLIFVNLSDSPLPFAEKIAGVDDYLSLFELQRFQYSYQMPVEHWQCNWKLAVENGIESYHLFKVHKQTLETTTPSKQAYYVAGNAEWALTGGTIKDKRNSVTKWLSGYYPEICHHYLLLFLPPSFIAVITCDGLNWIQILPQGPEQCRLVPGGLLEQKVSDYRSPEFQFVEAFLAEDRNICERVQGGMRSRKSQGGKLVSMEKILVDFRQYLSSRLFQTVPDGFVETERAAVFLKL